MDKDDFRRRYSGGNVPAVSWDDGRTIPHVEAPPRKFRVVIADDFAECSIMLACAMRRTKSLQVLHVLTNGTSALKYMLGQGCYADRQKFPFPDILVTELGLPCLEMLSFLSAMETETFQNPLRVVLTGSPMAEQRLEAERLGADAFYRKPERFHGLVKIAREIERLALFTAEREALLKLCGVRGA